MLAEAGVGMFAVPAFNADRILVKEAHLDTALAALGDAGYAVTG